MLGKLSVPGRSTNLGKGLLRLQYVRVGVVWTFFFLWSAFSLFVLSLLETVRYRLKYCFKGPLNPKQSTNQLVGL